MQRPLTGEMRHRAKNSPTGIKTTKNSFTYYGWAYPPGSTVNVDSWAKDVVVSSYKESFYDVVIPRFFERSRKGEIFNNAMYKIITETDTPLITVTEQNRSHYDAKKGFSGSIIKREVAPYLPPFKFSGDHLNVANQAVTQAYAGISANEGNTLLWLGEFKESLTMFRDVGARIKILAEQTAKQRKKWAKGKLTIPEQQKLTLALVFGILPLEQSIADFMDGLFRTKDNESRNTSRGFMVSTNTRSDKYVNTKPTNSADIVEHSDWTEHLEITARAGVLYEIDYTDVPWISVILDPKSVISTAYALARMSFVIDWFINVGNTLAAWSPSMGTKPLSAWVTVEVTRTITGTSVFKHRLRPTDSWAVSGQGNFLRYSYEKWRVPVDRSDLAIFPRLTLDLDLEKIALLVLLFLKVKKTL